MNVQRIVNLYREGELSTEQLRGALSRLKQNTETKMPLSMGQKGIWTLQKMDPEMSAYNVPLCLRMSKQEDIDVMMQACRIIWNTHPILKTVISEENGVPSQVIRHQQKPEFAIEDISHFETGKIDEHIQNRNKEILFAPGKPLAKVRFYYCSNNEAIFHLSIHHMIIDGTSSVILMTDLMKVFKELKENKTPSDISNATSYLDYVTWESQYLESTDGAEDLKYWKNQLVNASTSLDFPTDFPRHAARSFIGKTETIQLDKEMSETILDIVEQLQISPATFFLSIFSLFLHKYTEQEDITIGMPTHGRPSEKFESAIGYFINMIPVRSRKQSGCSFTEFARGIQDTMLDGIDHSRYPFAALVNNLDLSSHSSTSPIFQVAFLYQNFFQVSGDPDSDITQNLGTLNIVQNIHQEGEYELSLAVMEIQRGFVINLKYNPELYQNQTASNFLNYLLQLIKVAVGAPGSALTQLPSISDLDKYLLLDAWQRTERDTSSDRCVHELFEEQARQNPDAIAYVCDDMHMTYAELEQKSTVLALYLQKHGITSGSLVGVLATRTLDTIVSKFAILKAGGAYIPLDPDYPSERLKYMVEDSGLKFLISQSTQALKIHEIAHSSVRVIFTDDEIDAINDFAKLGNSLDVARDLDSLAYVLFTSGSTGKPKGVMIAHRALTNHLLSMADKPGLSAKDRFLAVTTFSFDIAGLEIFLPIIKGAVCYICNAQKVRDAEKLKEEIRRIKPTIMQATPVTWGILFRSGWKNEQRVKILCGGEALPEWLAQQLIATNSDAWNMFGPTETTIWSTIKAIRDNEPLTIGKPIANTQIYILDSHLACKPIGVPGELYIGGDGLAQGYLNKPELTREKFVDNPFKPGTKLYKTGDVARWLRSGEIEFLGRNDNQIKLHGFRIELGEIETVINTHPLIHECVVVLKKDSEHERLVAFYTGKTGEHSADEVSLAEMANFLGDSLPKYMLPSSYIRLESFPLTPNNKVDRKVLSQHSLQTEMKPTAKFSTDSGIEKQLLKIWAELLSNNLVNVDDGFFDVGGSSFLAVVAAERIKAAFGCEITATTIFEYPNISSISGHLRSLIQNTAVREHEEPESNAMVASPQAGIQGSLEKGKYPDYYHNSLAIIGISCQVPGASDYQELWDNLISGVESVNLLSPEELADLEIEESVVNNPRYVPVQSSIQGKEFFDAEFFGISPKDAELLDPQLRLLLLNSWKAIEDAGYLTTDIPNTAVYMSASNNFYHAVPEIESVHVLKSPNEYVTWLLAQAGTISTMVSFHLGLKGPSFSLHSNCSSSLVGLHTAFQSICADDVDYALVGASSLPASKSAGYIHQPGLNLSASGHLKAFDRAADGMVAGEGVAVVLVKKASKALDEGDRVYAVLRGVGINNDGSDKVGFYAPSVRGQEDVIQKVLNKTKIDPSSISYVEAHGTGTKLGDPIEFKAIKNVFGKYTKKKQYCGIGSIKTNLGHLDTAAGLAGCIKVALSLYYGEIPPTLNFKNRAEDLDFENSPFYIVDKTTRYEVSTGPVRAAVSSFGIGGTNTHAIFESPVETTVETTTGLPQRHQHLIVLSAKTQENLIVYAQKLADFIRRPHQKAFSIADLAYTLQVGRKAMAFRIALLASNMGDTASKLERFSAGVANISDFYQTSGNNSADRTASAIDLTQDINRYCKKADFASLASLWVQGASVEWRDCYTEIPKKVSLPTYPFSQKAYWRSAPESLAPSKKAVTNKTERLHPFLERRIAGEGDIHYMTRLRGSEFYLSDHLVNGEKVLPGVAYVEMVRAAGELFSEKKVVKISQIVWTTPIVVTRALDVKLALKTERNNLGFRVITESAGKDTTHCQGKIQFGSSATGTGKASEFDIKACMRRCDKVIAREELYQSNDSNGYLYGPTFKAISEIHYSSSEALSRIELPEECSKEFAKFVLHPSILEGALQTIVGLMADSTSTFMPFSIEQIEIFSALPKVAYAQATRDEISRGKSVNKFNIRILDEQGNLAAYISNYTVRTLEQPKVKPVDADVLFLKNHWHTAPLPLKANPRLSKVMVFVDNPATNSLLLQEHEIVQVKKGDGFRKLKDNLFYINPCVLQDYVDLLNHLKEADCSPENIIHTWSHGSEGHSLNDQLQSGVNSLLLLAQALVKTRHIKPIRLLYVYQGALSLASSLNSAVSGFAKTLRIEHPNLLCKTLGVNFDNAHLPTILASELDSNDSDEVCYRQEQRYIKQYREVSVKPPSEHSPFRTGGVYLITGGTGKLGFRLAEHLAQKAAPNLVLVGRSAPNKHIKELLNQLQNAGAASALYVSADITIKSGVQQCVNKTLESYGNIHGIFHCAGQVNDSYLFNKTSADFLQVAASKIKGAVLLDELTSELSLDIFVLYSSISYRGNAGQADYAYANSFLNHFAEYREQLRSQHHRTGKTLSISWPFWLEGGMAINKLNLKSLEQHKGVVPLPTIKGLEILESTLLQNYSQIDVVHGDAEKLRRAYQLKHIAKSEVTMSQPVTTKMRKQEVFASVQSYILEASSNLLKLPEVDLTKDMQSYGFDSIRNTEFINEINEYFGLNLMPTIFYELEEQNLKSLVEHIVEHHGEELEAFYSGDTADVSTSENDLLQDSFTAPEPVVALESAHNVSSTVDPFESDSEKFASAANQPQDIAIVGMSGKFPMSESVHELWQHIVEKKNLVSEIPVDRFDWRAFNDPKLKWGGFMKEVDKFDAEFFDISADEAQVMDPQHRLLLQTVWATIEDAGYKPSDFSGTKTGIFVGIGTQDYTEITSKTDLSGNPHVLTGRTPFMAVNRISSILNLNGPSEPVDTACSSSLVAVHRAVESIYNGSCDRAIVGGVNVILSPSVHLSFGTAGLLSDNGQCRTFDEDASGTVRAEGVGAVLLKKLDDAIADGDHIYGCVKSTAENHNGKSNSLTSPNANAQASLLVDAYQKAGVNPSTIGFIETHATATKIGDPVEIIGLRKAFAELHKDSGAPVDRNSCGISSLKSNLGHLECASGIASMIKVLLSFKHKKIPGIAHFQKLSPFIDLKNSPFHIIQDTVPWETGKDGNPRRAGVSTFGYGGVNAHVVLEEYNQDNNQRNRVRYDAKNPALVVLSARTQERLQAQAKQLLDAIQELDDTALPSLVYTLQMGREQMKNRLGLMVSSMAELIQELDKFIKGKARSGKIFIGQEKQNNEVLDVFSAEDLHNVISPWIRAKKYDKLLRIWVKGVTLDWSQLYEDLHPTRMSLPTYPFEAKRHWVDEKSSIQVVPSVESRAEQPQTHTQEVEAKAGVTDTYAAKPETQIQALRHDARSKASLRSVLDIEVPDSESFPFQEVDGLNITDRLKQLHDFNTGTIVDEQKGLTTKNDEKAIRPQTEMQDLSATSNNNIVQLPQELSFASLLPPLEAKVPTQMDEDEKIDFIVKAMATLLGIQPEEVDVDKSMEGLGMDSIILMQLLRHLQALDSGMNFEALYQCNKISEIANVFNPSGSDIELATQYPELIRMNTTPLDRRPIFWFHGGFGGVEVYRLIAPQIKRPFFGIQCRGYMTDREPLQGIQEMAAYYIEVMQSVQPTGPYDLGGLSLGGVIAYEVARQLQEKGEKVNTVCMIESFYVDKIVRGKWMDVDVSKLKKDRMFRAINVVLVFTSMEVRLIHESELDMDASDEEALEQLATLASMKSNLKSKEQYRKLIIQFEKVLSSIDYGTTFYDVEPLPRPEEIKCYFFYSQSGEIYGETESFFKIVDKGHKHDFSSYGDKWEHHFTKFTKLKVDASNHMGLFTEDKSQQFIIRECNNIYSDTPIDTATAKVPETIESDSTLIFEETTDESASESSDYEEIIL